MRLLAAILMLGPLMACDSKDATPEGPQKYDPKDVEEVTVAVTGLN